jgi:uncharacterized protein involved in type VI secretion and phage assembly
MPVGEEHVNNLVVEVKGTKLPDDVSPLLVEGLVDDSLNLPDLFVLRFNDEAGIVITKAGFELGAEVKLSVQGPRGGPTELLVGEVTALEIELRETGMHTVVRGLDRSHRLFHGTRVAAYQDMTAGDIVRQVAQRAGMQATVDATDTTFTHVTQDGVSDWEFLRRLARWSHRIVNVSAGKLEFLARPDSADAPLGGSADQDRQVLQHGVNLVALRATVTSAGQVPEVEVRGWDPSQKRAVVATRPAATPAAQLGTVQPGQLGRDAGSPSYLLARPSVATQDAALEEAASLADHLAGGFVELEGIARGNPVLRAGTAVELAGVSAPFAGKYLLSTTRHDFSAHSGYQTSFRVSNTSERSLFGAASAGGGGGSARKPGVGCVYPALVTNTKDPDSLGRVRVQLPWLSDSYESAWARTVFPGAAGARGMVSLPEVGDEVLVAFGDDDLSQPYVLGGLTNGKDGSRVHVDSNTGQVNIRAWTSRTGMAVGMEESSSTEQLQIATNDGQQRITMLQTQKGIEIVSLDKVDVTTDSGDVTVKGVNLVLESQGNLTLKATGNVTIEAQGNAGMKANGSLDLSSTGTAKLNAANTEVSGTAMTTVKGAMVRIN